MAAEPGTTLARRENLAGRTDEAWRPPAYACGDTRRARTMFAMRRFFDLQGGSIWRDMEQLLPTQAGTVADIGCGAQPYRPLLAASSRYIGIDTQDAFEHFGYDTADVRRLEGERWPLEDGETDVVLSTETLEHVPDPPSFVREAARCLRPGGRLILTVPFSARWHYIPHDYWRFTPSSLRLLLEANGFGEVSVWARGNALTVACYKAMALLLPRALPQRDDHRVRLSPWALLLGPPLAVLAAIGNASMRGDGGEDCLGFTVTAIRKGGESLPDGAG